MNKTYTRDEIYSIEREVAQLYYSSVRQKCSQENLEMSRLKNIVRNTSSSEYKERVKERIKSLTLENCDLMNKIRSYSI